MKTVAREDVEEVYQKPCMTSKVERFSKIGNGLNPPPKMFDRV